jgi:hypothetical protein
MGLADRYLCLLLAGASLLAASAANPTAALAAVPGSAEPRSDVAGSPRARSDVNAHSDDYGYHPGRRSFYDYPRHRHVDGGAGDGGTLARSPVYGSNDGSPNYDGNYGSAYYGVNYGAPYFGGGYYDGGVYYRERRD